MNKTFARPIDSVLKVNAASFRALMCALLSAFGTGCPLAHHQNRFNRDHRLTFQDTEARLPYTGLQVQRGERFDGLKTRARNTWVKPLPAFAPNAPSS